MPVHGLTCSAPAVAQARAEVPENTRDAWRDTCISVMNKQYLPRLEAFFVATNTYYPPEPVVDGSIVIERAIQFSGLQIAPMRSDILAAFELYSDTGYRNNAIAEAEAALRKYNGPLQRARMQTIDELRLNRQGREVALNHSAVYYSILMRSLSGGKHLS